MASVCTSFVRGSVARVTRVDSCCRPVCGERAYAITEGIIDVSYNMNIKEQEEIEVENFAGNICVSDTTCPELKWVDLEIQFCAVDPELMEIITGQTRVTNFAGNTTGMIIGEEIRCDGGFGLEVWAGVPDTECDDLGDPLPNFGYLATPCVINGILGDFTIENDAATFTVTGRTKRSTGWGRGPWDVVAQDIIGTPGRLAEPWAAGQHLLMDVVTVPPPDAVCGAQDGPEITVEVLTDADGDGTFSAAETAECPNADVPVQITITNSGDEATTLENVTLTDGTDTWDIDAGGSGFTGPALGSVAAGSSVVYSGTLSGWSPANQGQKALIATVEHQGDTSTMHCSDTGNDRVSTVAPATNATFGMSVASMDACPNPTEATATDGQTTADIAGLTCGTSAAGLASLVLASGANGTGLVTVPVAGDSDLLTTTTVQVSSIATGNGTLLGFAGAFGNAQLRLTAVDELRSDDDGFTQAITDGQVLTLGLGLDISTNELVYYVGGTEVYRRASGGTLPACGEDVLSQIGNNGGGDQDNDLHFTRWTIDTTANL